MTEKENHEALYRTRKFEFKRVQRKRTITTIAAFAITFLLLFYWMFKEPLYLEDFITLAIASTLIAFAHFYINYFIFVHLWKKSHEEPDTSEFDKAKSKRIITTIIVFTICFFVIFCLTEKTTNFLDALKLLLPSAFIASLYFFLNSITIGVFIVDKKLKEDEFLKQLELYSPRKEYH